MRFFAGLAGLVVAIPILLIFGVWGAAVLIIAFWGYMVFHG